MHFACIFIFIQCIKIKSKLVDDYFAVHLMVHLSLSGTVHKIVLIALHIFILTLKYQCRPTVFFVVYSYQFEMVHGKWNLIRS